MTVYTNFWIIYMIIGILSHNRRGVLFHFLQIWFNFSPIVGNEQVYPTAWSIPAAPEPLRKDHKITRMLLAPVISTVLQKLGMTIINAFWLRDLNMAVYRPASSYFLHIFKIWAVFVGKCKKVLLLRWISLIFCLFTPVRSSPLTRGGCLANRHTPYSCFERLVYEPLSQRGSLGAARIDVNILLCCTEKLRWSLTGVFAFHYSAAHLPWFFSSAVNWNGCLSY